MTTKDYIYLGMILLTALAFYCNGFYAGVYRCKKMYDTLADEGDEGGSGNLAEPSGKELSTQGKLLGFHSVPADRRSVPTVRDLPDNFGNN